MELIRLIVFEKNVFLDTFNLNFLFSEAKNIRSSDLSAKSVTVNSKCNLMING